MSSAVVFSIDLSRLDAQQRSDVSYELHNLQDIRLCEHENVGFVSGALPHVTVEILREKGYDVSFAGWGPCHICKKRMGRPSQDKVVRHFSIDRAIADFIDDLPDGQRSSFVNKLIAEHIRQEL